jgi:hypothetical protein
MRRLLTTLLLVGLLLLPAAASELLTHEAIMADYEVGNISRYEELLNLTRILKAPEELPERYLVYENDELRVSGTPIVLYVREHLDELPYEQADYIEELLLARPSSVGFVESSMYPVRMHYFDNSQISDAQDLLSYIEHSWSIETSDGGNPDRMWPPPPDYGYDYSDDYDFYFENIGGSVMGYAAPERRYTPYTDRYSYTSYIAIDIGMTESYNKSTACHELAHAVQFGTDYADTRLHETGAVYHEDVVYPGQGHDYSMVGTFQREPWKTIVTSGGDIWEYGSWIWYKFLEVRHFDPDGVWYDQMYKDAIQPTGTNQPSIFDSLNDMLVAKGFDIRHAFTEFSVWRLFTSIYHDNFHWPVKINAALHIDPGNRHPVECYPLTDGSVISGKEPQKMGMNAVLFGTNNDHEMFNITFDGKDNKEYDVRVIGYRDGEGVESDVWTMDVDNEYSYGSITIPDWSPYDFIFMIVVFYNDGNLDPDDPDTGYWMGKGDYTYTARITEMDTGITDFSGAARDEGVLLSWTPTDDGSGFNVYRDGERLNSRPLEADTANYLDRDAAGGSYTLGALTVDGQEVVYGPVEVEPSYSGRALSLEQNYPNPVQGSTTISFELPEPDRVSVAVYDISGRLVSLLADEEFSAGRHEVQWDAQGRPAGVYLYRLETEDQSLTRRLVIDR